MIFSSVFLTHSSDFFLSSKWDSSERTYNEKLFRNLNKRSPRNTILKKYNALCFASKFTFLYLEGAVFCKSSALNAATHSYKQQVELQSSISNVPSETKIMICKIILIFQKYFYKMHKYVLVKFTCLMGNDNLCIVRNCFFTCWTT